jgi:hypothetical protein
MTLHSDITIANNHKAHAFEYADATARGAATPGASDVGKLALQLDDYSLWILEDDSPLTWTAVGGGGGGLTQEQIEDFIAGTYLVAGNNIDLTYNDGAGTLTVDVESLTSADISDFAEVAQDSVGTILADSASIDFTYTDATPEITAALTTAAKTFTINFIIDGGGSAITTGIKGDIRIDRAGTITAARALADQSGSIVVDIWKDTYANHPPTDADSITASAPVTISAATKSEDTTLTGWTTSISAGDHLRFNVDSITTVQRVTIALTVVATA